MITVESKSINTQSQNYEKYGIKKSRCVGSHCCANGWAVVMIICTCASVAYCFFENHAGTDTSGIIMIIAGIVGVISAQRKHYLFAKLSSFLFMILSLFFLFLTCFYGYKEVYGHAKIYFTRRITLKNYDEVWTTFFFLLQIFVYGFWCFVWNEMSKFFNELEENEIGEFLSDIESSGIVTDDVPPSTIASIHKAIASSYGISPSEVSMSVKYVTTGTLKVNISDDLPNDEVMAVLGKATSKLLGVPLKDVEFSIDLEGIVTYTIKSNQYDTVKSATTSAFENGMKQITGVSDVKIQPNIVAKMSVPIDLKDVTVPKNVDSVIDAIIQPLGFNSTPAATSPMKAPIQLSFVSDIESTSPVTQDVSSLTITYMQKKIASAYGISPSEVPMNVDYVTTGTLKVNIPDGVEKHEIINIIASVMSHSLIVPLKDVNISIDPKGITTYNVKIDNYKHAKSATTASFRNHLQNINASGISVSDVEIQQNIVAMISAPIDLTDVIVPENINSIIDGITKPLGFDSTVKTIPMDTQSLKHAQKGHAAREAMAFHDSISKTIGTKSFHDARAKKHKEAHKALESLVAFHENI